MKLELRNESGLEFTDISSEQQREYIFRDGATATIENPLYLNVSDSGGHRILDTQGTCHYIPTGWVWLQWKVKDGAPHFIK